MAEYISKSYLITKFNELADYYAVNKHKRQRALAYATAADMIKLIDAADVQPIKHGYWTDLNNDAIYHYECSCCKEHTGWHEKFCPNCGARMDGDAE